MFTKFFHWILVAVVFIAALAFWALTLPTEAFALKPAFVTTDNSCLSCHEDLYYLHDSGCWYCMTEAHKDRCTDCHEGNPTAFKEKEAHIGFLRHPQENNGAKCRECHAEDLQARLDKFASLNEFEPVMEASVYIPAQVVEMGFPKTAQPKIAEKLTWAAGGIVFFGFWLALVFLSPQKP